MEHTAYTAPPTASAKGGIRRLEWITVTVGIFIHTGAVFPLLMQGADGILDDAERAKLRLLYLPIYALSFALLAARPGLLIKAGLRNIPMLLLLMLPVLSSLWSISPALSLRRSVALVLSMGVAFLLATRFTPRQQIIVIGTAIGAALVLSLGAGIAWPSLAFTPEDGTMRGVFFNKNVFGWMSVLLIIAGIAARHDVAASLRRAGTGMVVLGWTGCLLSTSMTSFFAGVAAVGFSQAVVMIARRRGIVRLVFQFGIILGLVLLCVLFILGFVPLLEALGRDVTFTGRTPLWGMLDTEIAQHPVLGQGYGAFWSPGNLTMWEIWETLGWEPPHAHNGYRDVLLGTGVVGLALFALVTLRAIHQTIALTVTAPREGWLWCIVLILSVLVMNLTESNMLMQNDIIWILFSTAVLTGSYSHAEARRSKPHFMRVAASAT